MPGNNIKNVRQELMLMGDEESLALYWGGGGLVV
jgi:hypothetical protein